MRSLSTLPPGQYSAVLWSVVMVIVRMSLDLVETLLNIAETGNFDEVLQLFSGPLKQCPEILFFGLLQAKVCETMCACVCTCVSHCVYETFMYYSYTNFFSFSPMAQQCRKNYYHG